MMRKLLILLAFLISMTTVHAEYIMKPYEIQNVLITFYFFDTDLQMQEFYRDNFAEEQKEVVEIDPLLRGFSLVEGRPEKHICHVDMYVVRAMEVDDEYTTTIGHEVLHCVYGPNYHINKWYGSIQLSQ